MEFSIFDQSKPWVHRSAGVTVLSGKAREGAAHLVDGSMQEFPGFSTKIMKIFQNHVKARKKN